MKLPDWPTLFAIAGGSGIGLGCVMLLMNKQRDQLANQSTFMKRAIDIMKEQQTVKDLLGDDIQVGKATFNDGWGKMNRSRVQIRVPVKGDRDSAYLYAYARRKANEDKLKLYKLEATFNKIAGKKLVIMDKTNEEYNGDNDVERGAPKESKHNVSVSKDTKPERKKTKEELREEMKSWGWR